MHFPNLNTFYVSHIQYIKLSSAITSFASITSVLLQANCQYMNCQD